MSERASVQNPLIKYSEEIGWEYVNRDNAVESFAAGKQDCSFTIYLKNSL